MSERRYRKPQPTKRKIKMSKFFSRFRKPKVPIPKQKGKYGVVKVIDREFKESDKWIKYTTRKHFLRQLHILEKSFGLKGYRLEFMGYGKYVQFTDEKYFQLLGMET